MFNIISYIIFLSISFYVTIDVGRRCYHEGKAYLKYLLHDESICLTINRVLLGCYYLLNLGYITLSLTTWSEINSFQDMITTTSTRVGYIILILCGLHYINIFTLYFLRNTLTLK